MQLSMANMQTNQPPPVAFTERPCGLGNSLRLVIQKQPAPPFSVPVVPFGCLSLSPLTLSLLHSWTHLRSLLGIALVLLRLEYLDH